MARTVCPVTTRMAVRQVQGAAIGPPTAWSPAVVRHTDAALAHPSQHSASIGCPAARNRAAAAAAGAAATSDSAGLARTRCGQDLPQLKAPCAGVFSARVDGPDSAEAASPALSGAGISFSPAELQAVVGDMTDALREPGIGTAEVGEIVNLLSAAEAAHAAAPPRCAALQPVTIQERGLHSLKLCWSDGGSAYPKEKVDMNQVTTPCTSAWVAARASPASRRTS